MLAVQSLQLLVIQGRQPSFGGHVYDQNDFALVSFSQINFLPRYVHGSKVINGLGSFPGIILFGRSAASHGRRERSRRWGGSKSRARGDNDDAQGARTASEEARDKKHFKQIETTQL